MADMSKFADIDIDPGIIRRAASGDARAHEIIYRAFSTPVYSICLRFTKVPAHAEDLVQEPDDAIDLDVALASLSDVSRAVVWLHDVEGFTHKEIAGFMGKTESFSKSQLSRAYQRLRPMLEVNQEGTQPEGAAISY
jgi:DNA-directed RNA polymerase specialized sigma24 family protein